MPTVTGRATDYITFTRASNATVTDSSGFIKWAGHNFLLASEQFDASVWVKGDTTVSANSTSAPNGTLTADKIVETATTAQHFVYTPYDSSLIGVPYTWGIWLKGAERTSIQLELADFATGDVRVTVNLTAGTIGTPTASGNFTSGGATISNAGSGWYYVTLTSIKTAGANVSTLPLIRLGTGSYLGVAGSGIFAWGAHLYRSDLGGMVLNPARGDAYYPTTPRNLLGYTEAFDNAAWVKGGATISADSVIAPNGLQTADKLVETAIASSHYAVQVATGNTGGSTFSIYAKAAERTILGVGFSSPADCGVYIDLTDGSLASNLGSAPTSYSVTPVGNGWYRLSVTNTGANVNNPWVILSNGSPSTARDSYTGDGTSGIYLWGAQLSDSASLDTYSPVYGAAVTSAAYYAPRLDFDPVTLAAKGLLVEEQRTNLVRYSRTLETTGSYWGGLASGTANTITIDNAPGPDGRSTSASRITYNTAVTGAGTYSAWRHTLSTTANGTYTFTIWLKAGTTSSVYLRFSDSGGNRANTLCTLTSSWQRFTVTGTTAASITTISCDVGADGNAGGQTLTAGTVYASGAQLEAGAFATSYIPTGAASATRSVDVASVSTQAFPYSSTAESVVVSYSVLSNSAGNGVYSLNDASANNRVDLRSDGTVIVSTGGATEVSQTLSPGVAGTVNKIGVAVTTNNFAGVANGGAASTDATVTMPASATILNLGYLDNHPSAFRLNGWIRQITYLPRRVTNAELQTRTS